MSDRMFGVVLWADQHDSKAVIWCEDHGNLAYYSEAEPTMHTGVSLESGDLIEFDVREDRECRFARNPQRVGTGYAPDLAHKILNLTQDDSRPGPKRPNHSRTADAGTGSYRTTDNVVAFPTRMTA